MGRRAGALWAVPTDGVLRVTPGSDGTRLFLGAGGALVVDELLRSAEELDITPLGLVVGRLSPRGCLGLSVVRQEPVIAIDPNEPPAVLRAES